jgi:hypothetical protein
MLRRTRPPDEGRRLARCDRAHHVAAVVLSATGRRRFFEHDVGDTVRTNVIGYIFADE